MIRLGHRGVIGATRGGAPVNVLLPTLSGSGMIGGAVFCSTGSWTGSPSSYTYQWRRNGSNIVGATSSSYTVVDADGGTTLTCAVTAINGAGASVPAVSSNSFSILANFTNAWSPSGGYGSTSLAERRRFASLSGAAGVRGATTRTAEGYYYFEVEIVSKISDGGNSTVIGLMEESRASAFGSANPAIIIIGDGYAGANGSSSGGGGTGGMNPGDIFGIEVLLNSAGFLYFAGVSRNGGSVVSINLGGVDEYMFPFAATTGAGALEVRINTGQVSFAYPLGGRTPWG